MKRGFTLVELMAIIILLASISLVTFVSLNSMIKKSQINNDKSLVNTIIDEATILYNDYVFNDKQDQIVNKDIYSLMTTKNKPEQGILILDNYGNVKISVKIEERCYEKDYDENNIILVDGNACLIK